MDFTTLNSTVAFLFFLFIISLIFNSWLKIRQFSAVPGPKPRLPLIGTNWHFFKHKVPLSELMNTVMRELYENYKNDGFCAVFNGSSPKVLIFDPNYAIDFLKDSKVINKAEDYAYLEVWLGQSLISGNGNTWKNKRKLLNPTFHSNILDNYIPSINIQCISLIKQLNEASKADHIDVRSLMSETTLNVIAATAMGINLDNDSKEIEEYRNSLRMLPTRITNRVQSPLNWYDFIFYRLPRGRQLLKDVEITNAFHRKVLDKRRQEFDPGFLSNKKQMAFLDLLLTLKSEDSTITDKEILDDVSTFLLAGHDTSSVCLTFTLYLLGKHVRVQQKLIEEMQSIFGDDKQRDVNKDDISRMHYTECVIKESLRLYSPIPQVGRKATDDFSIGPHRFPKGTSVFVFITDVHKNEKVFPNPFDFIPERFENATQLQASFIPFAIGPRNCIGQRFAMIEMKCILAHIFRNFTIKTMNKEHKLKVTSDIVHKPIEPVNIQFKCIK